MKRMTVTIEVSCENAAFEKNPQDEFNKISSAAIPLAVRSSVLGETVSITISVSDSDGAEMGFAKVLYENEGESENP